MKLKLLNGKPAAPKNWQNPFNTITVNTDIDLKDWIDRANLKLRGNSKIYKEKLIKSNYDDDLEWCKLLQKARITLLEGLNFQLKIREAKQEKDDNAQSINSSLATSTTATPLSSVKGKKNK